MGVAFANARTTDGARRGELATAAAVFVGVITNGICLEAACGSITALVITALLLTAAITLLVAFYNTVATALASDGGDVAVVGQTARLDTVPAKRRADVADATGRETSDARSRGWVHDEAVFGVTAFRAQRTALLGADNFRVGALGGGAVMDRSVGVARLVDDDLPLCVGSNDNVGASNGLRAVRLGARIGLRAGGAGLSQPGEAHGRARVACRH